MRSVTARVRCGRARRVLGAGLVVSCLASAMGGCAPETRVIRYKPWFSGLDGATYGQAPVVPSNLRSDPTGGVDEHNIVVTHDDGSVTLLARTGRQLMIHIYNTLAEENKELFTKQVLAEVTRKEFEDRGLDPGQAYDMLKKQEEDIVDLFNAIPYGENTPGVFLQPVGFKTFRLQANGLPAQNLKLIAMDIVMEGQDWKLRWFVPAPKSIGKEKR